MFSVRLTVTFYRLFPNAGSKIITERIHLKIHHALKETSSNAARLTVSKEIATKIANYFGGRFPKQPRVTGGFAAA